MRISERSGSWGHKERGGGGGRNGAEKKSKTSWGSVGPLQSTTDKAKVGANDAKRTAIRERVVAAAGLVANTHAKTDRQPGDPTGEKGKFNGRCKNR